MQQVGRGTTSPPTPWIENEQGKWTDQKWKCEGQCLQSFIHCSFNPIFYSAPSFFFISIPENEKGQLFALVWCIGKSWASLLSQPYCSSGRNSKEWEAGYVSIENQMIEHCTNAENLGTFPMKKGPKWNSPSFELAYRIEGTDSRRNEWLFIMKRN